MKRRLVDEQNLIIQSGPASAIVQYIAAGITGIRLWCDHVEMSMEVRVNKQNQCHGVVRV